MRLIRLFPLVIAAAVIPGLASAQGRGGAQPPKNLQVLPRDMPRNQVTAMMRTFAMGLGVRCEHCHAEDPNAPPAAGRGGRGGPPLDYALDTKEEKKIAREMLKMVMDINSKYLPTTGRTVDEFNRVTCETCHHGLARPQTIRAAMGLAVRAAGSDSAVALYRSLRTRYYGSGAYDFSELQLNEAGSQIASDPENRRAAMAILRLNLEFFPQSIPTMQNLANISIQAGDTAGAVDVLTKALEIQPNNNQLRNMLQRIRPGG
jgi:tetratricopeptide (TPR) repeat protein